MKKFLLASTLLGTIIFTANPIDTQASVLYNRVYTDVNRAFAGDVAAGRDASTVSANPAGMMFLTQPEIKGGGGFVSNSTRFESMSTAPEGILSSGEGGNPFDNPTFIPNLYFVQPFDRMTIGLGITVPYNMDTNYDDDWSGRFSTIKTKIDTFNIAPTIAFDVTDCLTFGIGVDIQYADFTLIQAKTLSNELLGVLSGAPITIENLISFGLPIPEFRTKITGSDWSFGVNTGVIAKVSDDLKLGLNFRSAITHSLDGDLATTRIATGDPTIDTSTTLIAGLLNLPTNTELNLPNIVTFGGSWDVNSDWNIGAQIQWFNWNRFAEIATTIKNDLQLPDTGGSGILPAILPAGTTINRLPEQFENTFSAAIGTEYRPFENIAFQLGFLYDQNPTQDAFRSAGLMDGDQYWLTTGLTYLVAPGISVNVGYAHIFNEDVTVNLTTNAALLLGVTNTTLTGDLESSTDIISTSLRLQF